MNSNEIWIALIGAASGILTAMGFGKIIPSLLTWFEQWRERKRKLAEKDSLKLEELMTRVQQLEDEIDEYKGFKVRTETAFKTLVPVIREIMREHPTHIALFDQLHNIIFEQSDNETK